MASRKCTPLPLQYCCLECLLADVNSVLFQLKGAVGYGIPLEKGNDAHTTPSV